MKSNEEKLNNVKKTRKKYWSEHPKRYKKRRKLKQEVSNFATAYNCNAVVYNLLQELVEQQYLQGAEKMEPTPTNALLFLTQNLKHNIPDLFHKELLNLLYNKYKGKDFNEFMKQIRNNLQNKRIKEKKS